MAFPSTLGRHFLRKCITLYVDQRCFDNVGINKGKVKHSFSFLEETGIKERKIKNSRITEVLELIDESRKHTKDVQTYEYKETGKKIKMAVKKAKEDWYQKSSEEMG